jgi:hypothetical protein
MPYTNGVKKIAIRMTKMIKNKEVIKSVRKSGKVLDIAPKTLRMWCEMDEWNIIDRDLEDVVHLDGPQTRRCNKKRQQRVSTIGRLGRPSKISQEIQDATDEGINELRETYKGTREITTLLVYTYLLDTHVLLFLDISFRTFRRVVKNVGSLPHFNRMMTYHLSNIATFCVDCASRFPPAPVSLTEDSTPSNI